MSDRIIGSLAAVLLLAQASPSLASHPACPNPAHDCLTTGGPGCSDQACCKLVCDFDPFCCSTLWDGLCVSGAASACYAGPQCNACCPADLNFDGVVGGADLGIMLGAWNTNEPCVDLFGDGTVNGADLGMLLGSWGPCPSATECACELGTHDCCVTGGPGCLDGGCCALVCSADPFCCQQAWDALCVQGANSLCGLECFSCPPSDHGCCATGGPGCTDLFCCDVVCSVDPFCCDVAWDAICVSEAAQFCGLVCVPCPPSAHDCCTTGAAGCSDVGCCDQVCAVAAHCCTAEWDTFCVWQADQLCEQSCNVCPPSDHGCMTGGAPGCSDEECCNLVCSEFIYCCTVAWDAGCVGLAVAYCALPECVVECVDEALPEGEPCGANLNGSCNSVPNLFRPIACGQVICGSLWAVNGTRDTDWYALVVPQGELAQIALSVTAELPVIIGLVNTGGVPNCALATVLQPSDVAGPCGVGMITACLTPGTWWLFVAPLEFSGHPCGSGNTYELRLTCNVPPLGPSDVEGLIGAARGSVADFLKQSSTFGDLVGVSMTLGGDAASKTQSAMDGLTLAIDSLSRCAEAGTELVARVQNAKQQLGVAKVINQTAAAIMQGAQQANVKAQQDALSVDAQLRQVPPQGICLRAKEKVKRAIEKTRATGKDAKAAAGFVHELLKMYLAAAQSKARARAQIQSVVDDLGEACGVMTLETIIDALNNVDGAIAAWELSGLAAGSASLVGDGLAPIIEQVIPPASKAAAAVCGCTGCGLVEHDCFTQGGPYCSDTSCCFQVCAIDPFCCDVQWDGICVQEAQNLCSGS